MGILHWGSTKSLHFQIVIDMVMRMFCIFICPKFFVGPGPCSSPRGYYHQHEEQRSLYSKTNNLQNVTCQIKLWSMVMRLQSSTLQTIAYIAMGTWVTYTPKRHHTTVDMMTPLPCYLTRGHTHTAPGANRRGSDYRFPITWPQMLPAFLRTPDL